MKFFLDTNVLLSAILWDGNERLLIDRLRQQRAKVVVSRTVLEEALDKLTSKFGMPIHRAVLILQHRTSGMQWARDAAALGGPDDVILATAAREGADLLVTGDRRLLHRRVVGTMAIVRPRDALRILGV